MWFIVCLLYVQIFSLIIICSCKDVIFILTKRIEDFIGKTNNLMLLWWSWRCCWFWYSSRLTYVPLSSSIYDWIWSSQSPRCWWGVRWGRMLEGMVFGGTTIVIGGRPGVEPQIVHNEKMVKMWVEIVLRKRQTFGMWHTIQVQFVIWWSHKFRTTPEHHHPQSSQW